MNVSKRRRQKRTPANENDNNGSSLWLGLFGLATNRPNDSGLHLGGNAVELLGLALVAPMFLGLVIVGLGHDITDTELVTELNEMEDKE